MTPSARLSAAIEILADIEARRRPAVDVLKDWGLSHRFAGSSDRSAIAGLVYDALRRKASSGWLMGEASPRAVLLGMLHRERGLDVAAITALCSGERFAPAPLTESERSAFDARSLSPAPAAVQGEYPDWLDPFFARVFGDERGAEGEALASRAPLDMRVNTLVAEREELLPKLAHLNVEPTRWSPLGLRIRMSADARSPAIHAEPAFRKGFIEIQDEGSQLAAIFAGAKPGEQVIDLAAGAGGKTLALAAAMENRGKIYGTDLDKRQLVPIHERLARAGARNIQVRTPRGESDVLTDLVGRADLVLIDAPCTGTGTWRRDPHRTGALPKQEGRIASVTCSVLAEENGDQVRDFVGRNPDFSGEKPADVAQALGERAYLFTRAALISDEGLLMTPRRTDTDGFFVSLLRRTG